MSLPVEELELVTQIAASSPLEIVYADDHTVRLHSNGDPHELVCALIEAARFAAWVRLVAAERPGFPAAELVAKADAYRDRPFLVLDPSAERLTGS